MNQKQNIKQNKKRNKSIGRQLILLLFVWGYLFMLCHTLARFPPPSSPSSSPFAAADPTPGGRAGPMTGRFLVFSFSSAAAPAVDGGMVGPMAGPAGEEGFCRCGGKAGPIAADALLPRFFSSSFFFLRCGGSAGPMMVEGAPSPCCGCGFFCRWGGSAGPIDAPAAGRAAAAVAGAPELVEVNAEP
jgi:hypothetical protein